MQPVEMVIDVYAHTNDPPSDIDRIHISHLVDEERTAVASLDTKISQLRAQPADLRLLRKKRGETIEKLRAITSPLRHLPPEILSLIFMQCPRTGDDDQVLRIPDPLIAPLLLVRICSRWRHIALATPMLWTELQLILPNWMYDEGLGKPWQLILMNNWVVNAAPLPISLAARCYSPDVLSRALTVTRRFKALDLKLSTPSMYALIGHIPNTVHIDAESLRIEIDNHKTHRARKRSAYSAFENSPSLRNFTLVSKTPLDPALLQFSLPWAQLTHLHIDEPLFFESMNVLVQCINLVNCTFGALDRFDDDEDVALHERTTFPSLTDAHFTFSCLDSGTLENFLAPLILPALKKLQLRSSLAVMSASAPFISFQMRSAFNLETLELHMVITIGDLSSLLGSLSSLKSFTLTRIADPAALFKLLSFDGGNYLLPQVERLEFAFVQSDTSLEPFIAMIRSRRKRTRTTTTEIPTVPRLKHIQLVPAKPTLSLDQWWWRWKLRRLFPKLEIDLE